MNQPVIPVHFIFPLALSCLGFVAEIAILTTTKPFSMQWWVVLFFMLVVLVGLVVQVRLWINLAADLLRIAGVR